MPKCSNCIYSEKYEGINDLPTMYYCSICDDWIEEKTAELDELGCDGYVNEFEAVYGENNNDDFTKRS